MQGSISPSRSLLRSMLRSVGIQASRISPYTNDKAALSAMLKQAGVDLILDVGANIGQYARERFASGYTGQIVSFEPLSSARKTLLKAAAASPNWHVVDQCALGDQAGTVTINVAEDSEASSVLAPSNNHLEHSSHAAPVATEVVPIFRLDEIARPYVEKSQSPFLKVDVQGFEEPVLRGATDILPRLVGLQIELSFVAMYNGQKLFPEMFALINGLGFTLHRMIPAWIENDTGRWLQADGLFFRT